MLDFAQEVSCFLRRCSSKAKQNFAKPEVNSNSSKLDTIAVSGLSHAYKSAGKVSSLLRRCSLKAKQNFTKLEVNSIPSKLETSTVSGLLHAYLRLCWKDLSRLPLCTFPKTPKRCGTLSRTIYVGAARKPNKASRSQKPTQSRANLSWSVAVKGSYLRVPQTRNLTFSKAVVDPSILLNSHVNLSAVPRNEARDEI